MSGISSNITRHVKRQEECEMWPVMWRIIKTDSELTKILELAKKLHCGINGRLNISEEYISEHEDIKTIQNKTQKEKNFKKWEEYHWVVGQL